MTNFQDYKNNKSKYLGKIRTYIRTSSKEYKRRERSPFRYDSLLYLQEQLELGFDPKWLITYHYFTPEELLKAIREKKNDHGFRDRYGFKYHQNLWNQVARDKWIKRRREELDWIIKDTSQIKNVELKHIYGVSRLNNLDKYDIPPMLFFHELGKVNLQFHTHQLMSQVPEEFNDKKVLEHLFNKKFRKKRKCFSMWKKIYITKVYEPKGIIDYLVKETNINHLSLDHENSRVINPYTPLSRLDLRLVI